MEGDLNNIDVFFGHGIRMMSPSHFFDNDNGGSAHGLAKGGLTPKGAEMIKRMQAKLGAGGLWQRREGCSPRDTLHDKPCGN